MRRLLLLLTFLDTLCTRVGISQGHNQAFIQTDSELRYLVDGAPSSPDFSGSSLHDDSQSLEDEHGGFEVLKSPIRFEPRELDFKNQPTGMPVLRRVLVYNLNAQSSIQMLSISGNTIHFHCSFFADKVIPPSGNTSFDVVFLGRDEGLVENTLYIHTSAGSFRFHVRAFGTPNPYRLKPFVGVKMPLNSSYSPMIQLHNPHPEPIQVLEMYSSGGDLHLELPDGQTEGPQTLWQIPPYQTKSLMKANFLARLENNHTAYIRIKTNTTAAEFLYLSLEVEVSSQPGIYCPQELIDFGLITSNSEARRLKLFVLNSGHKAIPVQNVIATPVTEAITINFRPLKISPDTLRPTVIAEVNFDPSLVTEDGLYTGKIVIKSKNSQFKVTIPYRAQVLMGHLSVDKYSTHFHLKDDDTCGDVVGRNDGKVRIFKGEPEYNRMARMFTVKNHFKVAVAVHNISLAAEAEKYFEVERFHSTLIGPGGTQDLFMLYLKPEAWLHKVLDSHVTLHTNISSINIPLVCFHGKVEKFFPGSPSQNVLDFGTLGMEEKRDNYFMILNNNPVTLSVENWGPNVTGTLLDVMGVAGGGKAQIMQRSNFSGMARSVKIPPNHYMVFRVGIFTPMEEGDTKATVFVVTDYESFTVPFKFRVAKGSLSTVPNDLMFESTFPGKVVELKLKVYSSFLEEMLSDSLITIPPSNRFTFHHSMQEGRTVIIPSGKSLIGRVLFDPGAECRQDETCYVGFSTDGKFGKEWLQESNTGDSDVAIAHALYNRFRAATTPSASFNITLKLDTNKVLGFLFKARAKLMWPRITKPEERSFPLTQIGNSSVTELTLNNPADSGVYIHLVPFAVYPDADRILRILPAWLKSHLLGNLSNFSESSTQPTFRILNVKDDSNGTLVGFADEIEKKLSATLQRQTKAFVLASGHKAIVRIKFQPKVVGKFREGIFVRNNLTGIELATFRGESVHGEFRFGKYRHDSSEERIFEFEMKEKHLKDCQRLQRSRFLSPVLSVKRSIRLKNTGQTTLYVSGFEVEGLPCEGYGFRVLNCDGFDLKPSETKDVDVAFSPDFTLSKVTRRLTIDTNIGSPSQVANFTLVATLPSHMLAVCGSVVPRPSWESLLYYSVNIFMLFTLVIVLVSSAMDSERIVRFCGMEYHPPVLVQRKDVACQQRERKVFDLRTIGNKVSQEISERDMQIQTEKTCSNDLRRSGNGLGKDAAKKQRSSDESLTLRPAESTSSTECSNFNLVRYTSLNVIGSMGRIFDFVKKAFDFGVGLFLKAAEDASIPEVMCPVSEEVVPVTETEIPEPKEIPPQPVSPSPSGSRRSKKARGVANVQRGKKGQKQPPFMSQVRNGTTEDVETSSTTTEGSNQEETFYEKDQATDDSAAGNKEPKAVKKKSKQQVANLAEKHSELLPDKKANGLKANSKKETKPETPLTNLNSLEQKIDVPLKFSLEPSKNVAKKAASKQVKPRIQEEEQMKKRSPSPLFSACPSGTEGKQLDQHPVLFKGTAQSRSSSVTSTSNSLFFPSSSVAQSFGGVQQQKAKKVTPVGKILPEIKKPENKGIQFGAVGTKPALLTPSPPTARKSYWSAGDHFPRRSERHEFGDFHLNAACGLPQVQAQHDYGSEKLMSSGFSPQHQLNQRATLSRDALGAADPIRSFYSSDIGNSLENDIGYRSSNTGQESLMRSLQKERRQLMEAYMLKSGQTDWPGFGENSLAANDYLNNLWDKSSADDSNRRSNFGMAASTVDRHEPVISSPSTSGGGVDWSGYRGWPESTEGLWSSNNSTNLLSGMPQSSLGGLAPEQHETRNFLGLDSEALSSIWSNETPPPNRRNSLQRQFHQSPPTQSTRQRQQYQQHQQQQQHQQHHAQHPAWGSFAPPRYHQK